MTSLWWARRDLRLHDNPALLEAQRTADAAAVFAWTPALHWWSGRRSAHLARSLWSLREDTGGALAVRRGEAAQVVLAAARQVDARVVFAAQEFSPAGVAEQGAVAAALEADGRHVEFVGSPYAVAPGRVLKSDGTPYRVFTPFLESWRAHGWRAPAIPASPDRLARLAPADNDVDLDLHAAHCDATDPVYPQVEFREARLLEAAEDFVAHDVERYAAERDRPDLDATSHLSRELAFGQIHPRTLLGMLSPLRNEGARVFQSQLAWREFHADTLWHAPQAQRHSLTVVLDEDDWAHGAAADAAFAAWREGRTGFTLVDAGMRQLAQTGWMHNRVRMVVASFLVKDLRVPWQRGAEHFRRTLLDYDHAQNQLNWQWVAGTGRDASPFFRIFNPRTQLERFDPHLRYVQRWIPELDTPAYPAPMIDHREARETTLHLYHQAKARR
ncbi:cryptochrome/photolyase family protein [Demequina sp.]|uniref:cryptochrome/photolyase family protein n=1 Tax=Demequina sp. TaxID=2050685 RepID=UPI003A861A3E